MKIKLVIFEDGIRNVGFRRISSLIKSNYPSMTTYIYNAGGTAVLIKDILFQQKLNNLQAKDDIFINPKFIKEIVNADVIAFSGLTKFARHIKEAASLVKLANNKAFIVWGGVHATLCPEDAIRYADAVCIGEGEKSFLSLLKKIEAKEDIDNCRGFWIRKSDTIKKNTLLPLMDNKELSLMPFQDYSFDIQYVTNYSLRPMVKDIYISQLGSKYTTSWVLGCPFKCSYCSNSNFLRNHQDYAKLRHPPAEYVINEILEALEKHDYINHIDLEDDNLLMLDLDNLKQFAFLYKERIGLPLFVPGLHPSTVNSEKLDILIKAGLRKVRMGIQSGSKKTLSFYNRNTDPDMVLHAATVISSFTPQIIPPYYDIIIDNPIETEEDKLQTLKLLRELKRPYLIYLYSLRVIPGTELYEFAQKNQKFCFRSIEYTYQSIYDKQMGLMVYLLMLYKISDPLFSLFLKISKISYINSIFFSIFQILFLIKMIYYEAKARNYQPLSMISPRLALILYKVRNYVFCSRTRNIQGLRKNR